MQRFFYAVKSVLNCLSAFFIFRQSIITLLRFILSRRLYFFRYKVSGFVTEKISTEKVLD